MPKIIDVRVQDCLPMPEVQRKYYNNFNYLELKNLIEHEGYDRAYPVRAVWNAKKNVYEVFDGIHRLQIQKDLGRHKIPLIKESLSRELAIAKGIKANKCRASLSLIDYARSLMALGEALVRKKKGKSRGRKLKYDIYELSRIMLTSVARLSQIFKLTRLPSDVQDLIGLGKIHFRYARELMTLLSTQYESLISQIASDVVETGMSFDELKRRIAAIKHKGVYSEDCRCFGCGKIFPFKAMTKGTFCPSCEGKVRNGSLKVDDTEEHNLARKEYLSFNDKVERLKRNGKKIPDSVNVYLEKLHNRWIGGKEPNQD